MCAEGHAIVSIWLGEQYFAGDALFLVIWLGMIMQSAQDAALVACRAAGLEFFAVSSVCCAALNLLLSWLLGVRFGLLGIALATIIAQLVTNRSSSMIILKSHLGFHFDAALLRAGLSMLVAAAMSFLLSKLLGLARSLRRGYYRPACCTRSPWSFDDFRSTRISVDDAPDTISKMQRPGREVRLVSLDFCSAPTATTSVVLRRHFVVWLISR